MRRVPQGKGVAPTVLYYWYFLSIYGNAKVVTLTPITDLICEIRRNSILA